MAQSSNDQDQLQKDIAALRKDLGTLTDTVKGMMNGAVKDAGAAANHAAKAAKAKGQASAAALEAQVQTHPFAALAIAFGVGLVASKLMSRND